MRALAVCKAFERTLWLPSYFCPWVVKAVKKYAWGVAFYGDSPLDSTPNLDSLRPGDSDIVVAVDYFGIRDLRFWARWKKSNPNTALIADISHSPFSAALSDDAFDVVFASLRKTMPITDGGYLVLEDPKVQSAYVCCQDELGNTWRYWVNLDNGLLYMADVLEHSTQVYAIRQTYLELLAQEDETFSGRFLLPDGTQPFSEETQTPQP